MNETDYATQQDHTADVCQCYLTVLYYNYGIIICLWDIKPVICLFLVIEILAELSRCILKLLHVCCLILKWQDRAAPEAATISVKAMKIPTIGLNE